MQEVINDTRVGDVEQAEAGDWLDQRIGAISASCRHVALLAAAIATCGSLYFSEVLGWVPCVLCWYQRILMYPLALLLLVGIIINDRKLPFYVLPLSLLGIGTSLYHYLLIKTTWLPVPSCSAGGVPCTVEYLNIFGFVNIPFLALTAFTIISIMMGNMLLSGVGTGEPSTRGAMVAKLSAVAIPLLVVATFLVLR